MDLKKTNETNFSFRVSERQRKYLKKLWTPPINNDADTIMQWLYDRGLVQNYIRKLEFQQIDDDTVQDEIQDIWLYLLEKKEKLKELYDTQGITGLTAYVSGVIARQIHSDTSQIYKKYKKPTKSFLHISETAWHYYDYYDKMLSTNTDYLTTENDVDIAIKNLYNDIDD